VSSSGTHGPGEARNAASSAAEKPLRTISELVEYFGDVGLGDLLRDPDLAATLFASIN
jgi:hypothetical protein